MKEDIRRSLLKRRRSLPKEKLKQVSYEINTHLINETQHRDLKNILVYQSIDNEPSIEQTTELAWQKDIEVYIPKVISKEKIIINKLTENSSYSKNKFGIKESNDLDTVELAEIDLAVLPLVGIDINGFRLGYGGGYYDRYIGKVSYKKKILKIGIAHSCQKINKVPTNKYDKKLDMIITEKYIFT